MGGGWGWVSVFFWCGVGVLGVGKRDYHVIVAVMFIQLGNFASLGRCLESAAQTLD